MQHEFVKDLVPERKEKHCGDKWQSPNDACGLDGSVSLWISCLEELCCGYIREQHPCVENYTLQYLRVMEA